MKGQDLTCAYPAGITDIQDSSVSKAAENEVGQEPSQEQRFPEVLEALPMSDVNYVICDGSASFAECMTPAYGIKMCFHRKVKLAVHIGAVKICEQKSGSLI